MHNIAFELLLSGSEKGSNLASRASEVVSGTLYPRSRPRSLFPSLSNFSASVQGSSTSHRSNALESKNPHSKEPYFWETSANIPSCITLLRASRLPSMLNPSLSSQRHFKFWEYETLVMPLWVGIVVIYSSLGRWAISVRENNYNSKKGITEWKVSRKLMSSLRYK
jgi:hypothetical protein